MATLLSTQITDRLAAMAATMTSANGYSSNIGASVAIAKQRGMGSDAPATFIIPGRQSITRGYAGQVQVEREVSIKAFADLSDHALDEHALVDLVLWDLRRCFGGSDPTLLALADQCSAGDDQPGYSEDGGRIVGGALTLQITYRVAVADPTTPV
jgi:hypothetical protein